QPTCSGSLCSIGCLDQNNTVAAINELKVRGISTIVVGFGSDVAGSTAANTLNAMANAGGFVRSCPNSTDSECTPGKCNVGSKTCTVNYFAATDSATLAAELRTIV